MSARLSDERPRCRKHLPVAYGTGITSHPKVICASCGCIGIKSNGRAMIGRPRRIQWLRKWDLGAIASDANGRDWNGQPIAGRTP